LPHGADHFYELADGGAADAGGAEEELAVGEDDVEAVGLGAHFARNPGEEAGH
jgi:hypothetical protein